MCLQCAHRHFQGYDLVYHMLLKIVDKASASRSHLAMSTLSRANMQDLRRVAVALHADVPGSPTKASLLDAIESVLAAAPLSAGPKCDTAPLSAGVCFDADSDKKKGCLLYTSPSPRD